MIRKLFNYVLLTSVLASISGTPVLAECGKASWYELTGRTASGVMADPEAYTAAHRSLPFGTKVTVTNLANGRKVDLIIVDRGPFVRGRGGWQHRSGFASAMTLTRQKKLVEQYIEYQTPVYTIRVHNP